MFRPLGLGALMLAQLELSGFTPEGCPRTDGVHESPDLGSSDGVLFADSLASSETSVAIMRTGPSRSFHHHTMAEASIHSRTVLLQNNNEVHRLASGKVSKRHPGPSGRKAYRERHHRDVLGGIVCFCFF